VTVYNHFRSRTGLLEAMYDELAARGDVHRSAAAKSGSRAVRNRFNLYVEADGSKIILSYPAARLRRARVLARTNFAFSVESLTCV